MSIKELNSFRPLFRTENPDLPVPVKNASMKSEIFCNLSLVFCRLCLGMALWMVRKVVIGTQHSRKRVGRLYGCKLGVIKTAERI